ncbi:MAG: hypothetical protein REI94_19310, partial [Moraxellaceae bacterium]|nr:hypothetical protein [Moraxellaceae bacterium]
LGQDRDALVSGGPRTGTGGLNSASLNGVSASSEEPVDSPAANHRYSAILLGHDNGAQLISGGPTKGSGGINGSRLTGRRNAP